jgi:alkanesulfonate monooxygenase
MAVRLHWFVPSHGDGREVARKVDRSDLRREPDLDYLTQVAQAAERLGFMGVLVPTGLFCEDAWLTATALALRTRHLRFMVALRPGLSSPLTTAQMVATFQRISDNRLMLNVVSGGDPDEQRRYGDWLDHDARYARTDEFLTVLGGLLREGSSEFSGEHYRIKSGLLTRPPAEPPEIFVGGASDAAKAVAARHADTYLTWGERPADLAGHVAVARGEADRAGRQLRFGTRLQVITRDTAAEAWEVVDRLLEGMDERRIAQAQRRFARSESEGQRRAARLHAGRTDALEVYPNVWAGYGLVRPGTAVALVGSHEEVADRLEEFSRAGVSDFILSGQPHVEEAYWFGEGVIPLLRRRGLLDDARPGSPAPAVAAAR